MRRITRQTLLALGLIVLVARPVGAEVTSEQVLQSIERGVNYLKSQQHKLRGHWPEYPEQPGGLTALCTLALINCGVGVDDPAVQKALMYLRGLGRPRRTYATAIQTMVFCAAEPEVDRPFIRTNVEWLQATQLTTGDRKGSWAYGMSETPNLNRGDNSNSQFAVLALYEAERVGVEVDDRTWRLALAYWQGCQAADGSWVYLPRNPSSGSMTCAGIASLVIASGQVHEGDATCKDGRVLCCQQQISDGAVERGLNWLGKHFSPHENPLALPGASEASRQMWFYYYLYCVERAGRLTGRRFLGRHDWYREGAESLLARQDKLSGYWKGRTHAEGNPLVATSLALLFLSKGRRHVVIGKLKHSDDNDWNLHRDSVQNLTRRIEQKWRRDLTWQTIDAKAATVPDLLQAPVLFISGRKGLRLAKQQRENLRRYVQAGGFIFAEACTDGESFDREFRQLMRQLFPDTPLRLLPADHAIWGAEETIDPKYLRPLYGINACCRTSVVYCPQDLSCYWELSQARDFEDYPPQVKDEINACLGIGVNVVAYATHRVLRDKLDRPQLPLAGNSDSQPTRAVLRLPKLLHAGGGDDAPNALPNLLKVVRQELELRVDASPLKITAADETIYRHPMLFMHGRRSFSFSSDERKALAEYMRRGGFVFADSICANPQFAQSVRRELAAMFPGQPLNRLPAAHPLFTEQFGGYDLSRVTLRDPLVRAGDGRLDAKMVKITPHLEGLELDGRLAFVFSPYDISCALENNESLECKGYVGKDAARIGSNVILFALQQ